MHISRRLLGLVIVSVTAVLIATAVQASSETYTVTRPAPATIYSPNAQTFTPNAVPKRWIPAPWTTWQWQLTKKVDTSVRAAVYDIDGFNNSAATVKTLHAKHRKVICYISVGSWENWRPDKGKFPASVKGNPLDDWPGEVWLDIRQTKILKPIMAARFKMCKQKGFDAVEPDNVDGFEVDHDDDPNNDTGFNLSSADQYRYNKMIASIAHSYNMSVGLKNDVSQVASLLPYFDFHVDEQCFEYSECSSLMPFIRSKKAVFEAEYDPQKFNCVAANQMKISTILKNLDLDSPRKSCH